MAMKIRARSEVTGRRQKGFRLAKPPCALTLALIVLLISVSFAVSRVLVALIIIVARA